MMTFMAVMGGILAANVIWTVAMIALMNSKKVRTWFWDWNIKCTKEGVERLEEEGL